MVRSRRKKPPKRRPLTLLLEDEHWIAIQKPAGIAVHSGAGQIGPSIVERLEEEQNQKLYLVHRLDRGTCGVLLLAKTSELAREGAANWPSVQKTYWAMVCGSIEAPRKIEHPLPDPDGRARTAETTIEATYSINDVASMEASICRITIKTGRLHQIRRHLAQVGHPILMDDRYGDFGINKRFAAAIRDRTLPNPKHPLLMCWRLTAPTRSSLPTELTAPWPNSWTNWLKAGGVTVDDLVRLA